MSRKRYTPEEIIGILREARSAVVAGPEDRADQQGARDLGTEQLLLAPGVRWPKGRPGQAPEGAGKGEPLAA